MGIENYVEFSYNYNDQCYKVHTVESDFLYEPLTLLSNGGNERIEVGIPFLCCVHPDQQDLPKRSPFLYEVPNGSILGHTKLFIVLYISRSIRHRLE